MDTDDIVIIGAGAKLIWGSVPGRSVAVGGVHRSDAKVAYRQAVARRERIDTAWRLAAQLSA